MSRYACICVCTLAYLLSTYSNISKHGFTGGVIYLINFSLKDQY